MTRIEGARAAAMRRRVARIVAATGVMAWPGGALHGQVETAALAAEVEAREVAFARTLADRDLEAFPTYISPDAVFFNGEVPIRGREAIVAAWTGFFETPEPPFAWRPDQVVVLASGDLALSTGPVLSPSGEVVGRFNSIWRREADGVWRVVFDKGS